MTRRRLQAFAFACLFALAITPADAARQKKELHYYDQHSVGAAVYLPQYEKRKHPGPGKYKKAVKSKRVKAVQHRRIAPVRSAVTRYTGAYADVTPRILPHPPGCPPRAFCGCGAALDVFGKHVRELWLARNWFQFPRSHPAPGMVAVRRHHVFVIREVRGGNTVLAYDANSGGRKTRLHMRSLAGYVVVNPRGYRTAAR